MGTSVSGGWKGLPANPRRPLNFLPRSVRPGRNENLRMVPLSQPIPSPMSGRAHCLPLLVREGQAEREGRASAEFALDLELLTMELDDLTGEGKTQARTTAAAGDDGTSPVEAPAQVLEVGGRDTRPVVADSHPGMGVAFEGCGTDGD